MRFPQSLRVLIVVSVVSAAAFFTRGHWMPMFSRTVAHQEAEETVAPVEEPKVLKLTPQARKNLGVVAKAAKLQTYWRKIQVPGEIVDQPDHDA